MDHSRYRWVIVAAGGILGCVAIGAMFSLPVLLQSITRDTGWSVAGVSSAMTIGFLAMAFGSMAWGTLSDRWGPLPVVLTGTTVLAVEHRARQPGDLARRIPVHLRRSGRRLDRRDLCPMMATVTGWFDTHRSLAVSLVSAGMGIAPMTMAPLVAWLVTIYDWRTTMLIVAGIVAAIMIPVSLLVRRPPALAGGSAAAAADGGPGRNVGGRGGAIAAVHHPAADEFLLLRHAFGTDHPHGELCRELRHSAGRGGVDLQPRRVRRAVRPHRVRRSRRPARAPSAFSLRDC